MNTIEKKSSPVKESTFLSKLTEKYLEVVIKNKEEKMQLAARNEKYSKQMMDLFQKAGFDIAAWEKIEQEQTKETEAYIKKTRPAFADRKSDKSEYLKLRSEYEKDSLISNNRVVAPVEAVIVDLNTAALETSRAPGWIFPINPSEIKIMDTASGHGRGWPGQASTNPPAIAAVRFSFVPDKSGLWNLCPILAFEGYFDLYANDTFWTSKSAWVTMDVITEVKQYNHRVTKRSRIIERGGQNVDRYEFIRSTEYFDIQPAVLLRADDDVDVTVTIEINASARGGGSHAEINFQSGQGNYILPLLMLANPVS